MLTVTAGPAEATRHIVLYSYLLLSLILLYIAGAQAGLVFALPALALTGAFLWLAHALRRDRTVQRAMRLFHFSNTYLALVFVAAALDAVT